MAWNYIVTHINAEGDLGDEVSGELSSADAETLVDSLSDENDYAIVGVWTD